jgi:hypothetical protein
MISTRRPGGLEATMMFLGAGMLVLLVFCCPAARAKDQSPEASAPQKTLSNGLIQVTVMLPDSEKGYYRGTRFDWSGLILRAPYKGHTFFGPWKTTHDPLFNDDVVGPAEEFGMQIPLGYREANAGATFLKIGVGELEKTTQADYQFWHTYKIVRPGTWAVSAGPDWIEFEQHLEHRGGWKYQYVKRIELFKGRPSFAVHHRLKNIGSRPISTNHYCHNFVIIDGRPIDAQYQLLLPFSARSKSDESLKGAARVDGRKVSFLRPIGEKEGILIELAGLGGTARDNQATVENMATGASLHIKGDRPLTKYNVYVAQLAICPEPFIDIQLEPGRETAWSNEYSMEVR